MMRGKSRSITPIKARRNQQNDTCQTNNYLTVPVLYSTKSETNISTRSRRNTTLPPPKSSSSLNETKSSNALEICEYISDIQVSTFEGLTTPQSQLMKVLYLNDKKKPKVEPIEKSLTHKKNKTHLTVDTFLNSSCDTSSSCDSFLSLTFSSNPQTPTNPPENHKKSKEQSNDNQVISEGQVISSILVEIVRFMILPFIDLIVYLYSVVFDLNEIEQIPFIKVISVSNSESEKLSNSVGDLLYPNNGMSMKDNRIDNENVNGEKEEQSLKDISLEIPKVIPNQKKEELLYKTLQKLVQCKKLLNEWISNHEKTFFSRNGKSCRALVRNEVKHLSELSKIELSQAKSLTDLIKYWRT